MSESEISDKDNYPQAEPLRESALYCQKGRSIVNVAAADTHSLVRAIEPHPSPAKCITTRAQYS
jgi:hypothetical protein